MFEKELTAKIFQGPDGEFTDLTRKGKKLADDLDLAPIASAAFQRINFFRPWREVPESRVKIPPAITEPEDPESRFLRILNQGFCAGSVLIEDEDWDFGLKAED